MSSDYASEFHLYRVEWLTDRIEFYVDDKLTDEVTPPAGGFFELAQIIRGSIKGTDNPWLRGSRMAPFDAPVKLIDYCRLQFY